MTCYFFGFATLSFQRHAKTVLQKTHNDPVWRCISFLFHWPQKREDLRLLHRHKQTYPPFHTLTRVLSFKMTGIADVSYQLPLQSCPRQCHPPSPPSQSWSPSPRYRFRSYSESGGRHITRITQGKKVQGKRGKASCALLQLCVFDCPLRILAPVPNI